MAKTTQPFTFLVLSVNSLQFRVGYSGPWLAIVLEKNRREKEEIKDNKGERVENREALQHSEV